MLASILVISLVSFIYHLIRIIFTRLRIIKLMETILVRTIFFILLVSIIKKNISNIDIFVNETCIRNIFQIYKSTDPII